MPEYRRFVSYFYEYIDGKRQKSAGFAKTELRNGMWRILLKLTAKVRQETSIQVYGFVREAGYLLGIPLGTIRPVQEVAEEWAFREDAPIGEGTYRLEDLAGIRIESGDGRCFMTAWDDEEIGQERFVLEIPEDGNAETPGDDQPGTAPPEMEEKPETPGQRAEDRSPEIPEPQAGDGSSEITESQAEDGKAEIPELYVEKESSGIVDLRTENAPEKNHPEEMEPMVSEQPETRIEAAQIQPARTGPETPDVQKMQRQSAPELCGIMKELFGKRARFQPFSEGEIGNCVMILPCDIVRLQQENWKVGRSSFLQHGFYQYRHLLLGMADDGTYLLGVPGVRNPQEEYMAQMFGYGQFRESERRDTAQPFGYWCRELHQA